jgi:hypothetical protein
MTAFSNFSTPDLKLIRFSLDLTREKYKSIINADGPQAVVESKVILSAQCQSVIDAGPLFGFIFGITARSIELINAIDDELGKRTT